MNILIQGESVNLVVFDGDHVDVILVKPSFRVDAEANTVQELSGLLNNRFREIFTGKMISTESYQDIDPTSMIRELNIELVKNEQNVPCIRCSIEHAWFEETEIPIIVDYDSIVSLRCEEFGVYDKYKAVVIDALGYSHGFFGVSPKGFNTVFKSKFIKSAPEFKSGTVKTVTTNQTPIHYPLIEGGMISNLNSWYKL